jgi:FkbM family methyltransferase
MLTPVQRELKRKYIKYLNATESVDKNMIVDCITNYITPEIDFTDKVCLDLGGNVGGFTKVAIDGGAKAVYTVECDIRNYEKMVESFKDESKANIIHAAVSDSTAQTIRIFKGNSQQAHCSVSIMKRSKFADYDEVDNVHISTLLKKYQPDIIKIDIEGAEYQIIEFVEAYQPEALFVELHMGKVKQYAQPTLERLSAIYPKQHIKELIVFQSIAGYDCWFTK